MEEKKQIKMSLSMAILLFVSAIIIVLLIVFFVFNRNNGNNASSISTNSGNYKQVSIDGKIYYQRLNKNTWKGEYHQDNFYTANQVDNIMKVVSYSDYVETIKSINDVIKDSNKISKYYSNNNSNYIVLSYANGHSWCEIELIDCLEENNKIIIYGNEDVNGVMADGSGYFIAIPTNMPIGTEIEYRECYSSSEINNLKKYDTPFNPSDISIDKPIIYLYPQEEIRLTVKLGNKDKITCSYPNYTNGWNIIAKPNGDLIDLNTNKNLYALYYESEPSYDFKIENDGFIVKRENIIEFLEEKLDILGLTDREAEEFIVYWLPKLQENEYNYIRFATSDEINKNMPLEINPKPDTIIRVLMTYKGLDKPLEIKEQQLTTPERNGFVSVEWGGTEIK